MKHLKEVGMNYIQHMAFALNTAFELFIAVIALVTHAFVPCLFEKTGSCIVKDVYERLFGHVENTDQI